MRNQTEPAPLPLSVIIATGIMLGCGIGGAGFYYLEAPGWAVAWLALFAGLGWLGYTAAPVFDESNPVQAAVKPTRPRPVRDGSLLMVDLPGGRFLMGSPDSDDMARDDEKPQHEVTVSPFRITINRPVGNRGTFAGHGRYLVGRYRILQPAVRAGRLSALLLQMVWLVALRLARGWLSVANRG